MISAISGATLSASLRTGTTMETATGVLSEEGKSRLIVFSWMKEHQGWNKAGTGGRGFLPTLGRPLLWGGSAPGNPFEPSGRGSRQRHNGAVAVDRKSEPSGREPVAHEHRADD